ncbi:MAG: ribose 5-phosphate isomerase A [Candidatus Acetothermia bacterium]
MDQNSTEELKQRAVDAALDWFEKEFENQRPLVMGVGSGTTISYAFERLGNYEGIVSVPTSSATKKGLQSHGVPVRDLDPRLEIVVDIDGADEVSPELTLLKGGGGCHYQEKKVAETSKQFVIVVDERKLVDYIGQRTPLPVEVKEDRIEKLKEELAEIGPARVRKSRGDLFRTDQGNPILDVTVDGRRLPDDFEVLESRINKLPGVIENGIFARRKPELVFVGGKEGVQVLTKGNYD